MAFRNTSQIVPGFPPEALMKFGQAKPITSNGLATFASPRPRTLAAGLFVVFLFCVSGQFSKAWAIDIYHFLVEFKNGRIVERIFPESPENYRTSFKEYVVKTKFIEKRYYSVGGFIQTFGEDDYERLMTGYFGFGLEEQIIFNRQTQGLEFDAGVLPRPDETSSRLAEKWKQMENENIMAAHEEIPPPPDASLKKLPQTGLKTTPARVAVREKTETDEKETTAFEEKIEDIALQTKKAPISQPAPPSPSKIPEKETIDVYRFLVRYINDKIIEKSATMTPDQYAKRYQGYVKKTALIEKKAYTERQFKTVFGENAHNLLVQGNFGVGDIEMVMQSRIERGMSPRENVLPKPGPDAEKLSKRLEHLLRNKNFTLRGP